MMVVTLGTATGQRVVAVKTMTGWIFMRGAANA